MIPNGKMNATLLHREGDGYRLYSLNGCSWRMANVRTAEGNIVSNSVETTCRIPHPQQKPSVGDLLILGQRNVEAKDEIALVRLMNALNASGHSRVSRAASQRQFHRARRSPTMRRSGRE